jgi:hypothetical protein
VAAPRAGLTPRGLLELQRLAGNQATGAVLARVRTDKTTSRVLIEVKDIDRVVDRIPSREQGKPIPKKIKASVKGRRRVTRSRPRLLAIRSVNTALLRFIDDFRVPKTIPPEVLAALRRLADDYGRTPEETDALEGRFRFEQYLTQLMSGQPAVYEALMKLTTRGGVSFAAIVQDVRDGKKCNQELAGFLRNALGNAVMEKPNPKPWLDWLKKVTRGETPIELESDYWTPIPRPPRGPRRSALPALAGAGKPIVRQ